MIKFFFIFLFFLFLTVLIYAYFFEPYSLKVVKKEIFFKNLPPELEGLKIVHLSDFHCRKFTKREEEIVKIISEEKPDFIFFTGDFLEDEKYIPVCQELISQISRENSSFFGVFGNHDHRSGAVIGKLKEVFEKKGIKILVNESKEIKIKNSAFYLIGVDDPYLGYDDLKKANKGVKNESFKILLSHSPKILEKEKNEIVNKYDIRPPGSLVISESKIRNYKIDLILAGHSHGGQVNLPIYNSIFRYFSGYRYIAGVFEEGETVIYVNRGVGVYSGAPLRLNARPEITLITLRAK